MPFKCEKCNVFFANKLQLNNHINKKNPCVKAKILSCSLCNDTFSTIHGLHEHVIECKTIEIVELKRIVAEHDEILKRQSKDIKRLNRIFKKFESKKV